MKCNVCNGENWSLGVKLKTCLDCGFVKASDEYYQDNINFETLYDETYYNGGDYVNYSIEVSALKKNFTDRLKLIKKYVPLKAEVLEIGSGYGYFLECARHLYSIVGVERNPAVAKVLQDRLGIKIYGGDFNKINFDKKFDAIVTLDTIEHIANPEIFIKKCYELLNPGGWIFIETGDIGSLIPKLRGEKWRLVHPPEHLSYFTLSSLMKLLEDRGFSVVLTKRVSFWRSVSQTIYRISPKIYNKLPKFTIYIINKLNFPLNTFDLMFIAARKS
jgi:SAM-dependent methyltransferase